MRPIFISYRRQDSEGEAGRLFDDLKGRFGEKCVFMDVEALEYGRDFRKELEESVAGCGVLLAIIGKNWLDARDSEGNLRLNSSEDFVHRETAAALKRDIPVIPVLVRGATMPRADQLPEPLKELAFRNAIELTHARWNSDLNLLIQALRRTIAARGQQSSMQSGLSRPKFLTGGIIVLIALVLGFSLFLWKKAPPPANITNTYAQPADPAPAKSATEARLRHRSEKAASEPALSSAQPPANPISDAKVLPAKPEAVTSLAPSQTISPVPVNTVLYALAENNDLLWYSHTGRNDGTFSWANSAARKVGVNWNFKQLFSGGDGVIYGVTPENDLMWFRHAGRADGSFQWAATAGRKVGAGWNFKHIFSGGGGILYALAENGDLFWFHHDGYLDGSFRWSAPAGKKVGVGWNVKQIFSGGNGVIYTIDQANRLMWFHHDGRADGSFRWSAPEGRQVGAGWDVTNIFSSGDGVIYTLNDKKEVTWFHHTGYLDGTFRWAFAEGKIVGRGWAVKQLFSGADLHP